MIMYMYATLIIVASRISTHGCSNVIEISAHMDVYVGYELHTLVWKQLQLLLEIGAWALTLTQEWAHVRETAV